MNENYWNKLSEPIFLPDIGTFFNQNIDEAKTIISQLHDAGIKVFKGEVLHNANICLANDTVDTYYGPKSQKLISENYRALIERKTVSLSDYEEIFKFGMSLGMECIVSVYDYKGADFAKEIGCKAIKIATSNVTHQALITYVAKLELPMIIDTGGSTLEEITRAVNWAMDAGNHDILIEHSPPAPPAPVEQHNLYFMQTLNQATGLPVGLSDHHSSEEMLYAAVALGAKVVEKGVCRNDIGDEQDAGHAIKVQDIKTTAEKIQNISLALGSKHRYLPRERIKKTARMGMIAKSDIKTGETFNESNIHFAFPVLGLGAEYFDQVNNKIASQAITAGNPICWQHINPK